MCKHWKGAQHSARCSNHIAPPGTPRAEFKAPAPQQRRGKKRSAEDMTDDPHVATASFPSNQSDKYAAVNSRLGVWAESDDDDEDNDARPSYVPPESADAVASRHAPEPVAEPTPKQFTPLSSLPSGSGLQMPPHITEAEHQLLRELFPAPEVQLLPQQLGHLVGIAGDPATRPVNPFADPLVHAPPASHVSNAARSLMSPLTFVQLATSANAVTHLHPPLAPSTNRCKHLPQCLKNRPRPPLFPLRNASVRNGLLTRRQASAPLKARAPNQQ